MTHGIQKILITGATGTIGSAVARAFAGPGRRLALHWRASQKKAEALAQEIAASGAEAALISADLSHADEATALVSKAFDQLGGLDLLVHCAALFERTPLGTVTEEQWRRIVDLDLRAAFFIAQEAGMRMQQGGGRMVFLSDVAAVKPYGGYLPYCIAKAGVDALVRGLAKSLSPKVTVNAVAPYVVTRPAGITDRGWNDLLSKMPTRRAQTAEEIAAVIKMLAESAESITGQVIAVDGGRLLR